MSSVFISHSGRDNRDAEGIKEWLEEQGYRAVFLDRDPVTGIPAGSDWEQQIYRNLERCRAVVLLCSEASMASRWCFAEIAHTRALGKPIFPLLVGECELWQELLDTQFVDLREDPKAGLERLKPELERVVEDRWTFEWTPNGPRPPYRGLLAFEREDAAIFFGRDEEIRRGLELLDRLRRFSGTRLAVVVGASSSGKSSLLRAGLLPRLGRDRRNWRVLDPIRPLRQPFVELALALAAACKEAGVARGREEIQTSLIRAAENDPPDGAALVGLVRELVAAGQATEGDQRLAPACGVLLPIDPLEELLGSARGEAAEPFLRLLRAALEHPDSPLVVIATLRSDYLADFQQDPALAGIRFRGLPLGTMSDENFRKVIEGPAEVDELELEEGLVEDLLADAETAEALPLLAFALGELHQMAATGGKRKLERSDYRERLGGLAEAVGQRADAALAAEKLSPEQEKEVRGALVRLVEIDDAGHYSRRPVRWSELPAGVHPILERFVEAGLLTSAGDGEKRTVELCHDALFRNWKKMIRWRDEDRELLLWRKRIEPLYAQWRDAERAEARLLHGPALVEALSWHQRQPQEDLGDFIVASERAARRRRNRRLGLAAAVIAVVALLVSMILSEQLQTARIRDAWARAERARWSAELAEDDAVALAQQARIFEQRARVREREAGELAERVCGVPDIAECLAQLEDEAAVE